MKDLISDRIDVCAGMVVLLGYADTVTLHKALNRVLMDSPLRQMQTSRGFYMSVQTSNCGNLGWVSDRQGYRYTQVDPVTEKPWPAMPFYPDACLINHYKPGTQMGAHQDKDESDFSQPIVSVSLGIDARFFVVGPERRGKSIPIDLSDGDVVVFGGPARRHFHGVRKLKESVHPRFGSVRWNLTFRKAG